MGVHEAVMATAEDASMSKSECAARGYFGHASLADVLWTSRKKGRGSRNGGMRMNPLINRGTFARTTAVREAVAAFIARGRVQVLSLGAGMDALPFELRAEGRLVGCRYYEVDAEEIVRAKLRVIRDQAESLGWARGRGVEHDVDDMMLATPNYALIGADILNTTQLESQLNRVAFDWSLPTLLVFECVLVYSSRADTDPVLSWLHSRIATSAVLIYEQLRLRDAFGEQMMRNLMDRGCPLLGVVENVRCFRERLLGAGWSHANAMSMMDVWENEKLIPRNARERAVRTEHLDEVEEWLLFQEHYCIALAASEALADYLVALNYNFS